jgi:hypothetical protein
MTESKFEHEYLFVLGNGASIASADPELRQILRCTPKIEKFVPLIKEIKKIAERNEKPNFFELSALMDKCHLDILLKNYAQQVIEISRKRGAEDIVKLLACLMEERNCIGRILDTNQYGEIDFHLVSESRQISNDINALTGTIFSMVGAYYKKIDDTYFSKLWQLVQRIKSPIISLNWDINFERTIYENTQVDMKNYYGECAFGHLFPSQQVTTYDPIVDILKPHGSLNWHFVDQLDLQGRYGGNLPEKDYHFVISNNVESGTFVDYTLRVLSFLIPPLSEKEIPLINENNPDRYWDPYWKRKKAINDDIFNRIKEYAASTRTLVIIGYSFPVEDEHIKNLFAINHFENVWVLDPSNEIFNRIDKEKCFAGASRKHYHGGFKDILKLV